MKARRQYLVSSINVDNVGLIPVSGLDNENLSGQPGVFGTSTIIVTTVVAPDPNFWRGGRRVLVEFSVLDG